MKRFCTEGFFTGLIILTAIALFGDLRKYTPLIIWTTGMAVGMLASRHDNGA